MKTFWIPLLTKDDEIGILPDPRPGNRRYGFLVFLINNAEPIRLALYAAPLVLIISIYASLHMRAEQQRILAERALATALEDKGHIARSEADVQRTLSYYAAAFAKHGSALRRTLTIRALDDSLAYRSASSRGRSFGKLLSWSFDGRYIAGNEDGDRTVYVWNGATASLEATRGRQSTIDEMEWSPVQYRLAIRPFAASEVTIWDVTDGTEVNLSGHRGTVGGLLWSPDGAQLATWGEDKTFRLWRAADGKELTQLSDLSIGWRGAEGAWSQDGKYVALLSGAVLQILRIDGEGVRIIQELSDVTSFAWTFQGSYLVSGHSNGDVTVWTGTDKNLKVENSLHPESIISVAWAPSGTKVASVSRNSMVLWDLSKGQIRRLPLSDAYWAHVSWSPIGDRIAVTSNDGDIILLDASEGQLLQRIKGSTSNLSLGSLQVSVEWAPDGETFASTVGRDQIAIWKSEDGKMIAKLDANTNTGIPLRWHPQGVGLASYSMGGVVHIWERRKLVERFRWGGTKDRIERLAFAQDDTMIGATVSFPDSAAYIFDLRTGEPVVNRISLDEKSEALGWLNAGSKAILFVAGKTKAWAIDPHSADIIRRWHIRSFKAGKLQKWSDGWQMYTKRDGTISLRSNDKYASDLPKDGEYIGFVDGLWSSDGKEVALYNGGEIDFVSALDEGVVHQLGIQQLKRELTIFDELSWSPDKERFVLSSARHLLMFDVTTGTELVRWELGTAYGVVAIEWSPSGKSVAIGTSSGYLWLLSRNGELNYFGKVGGNINLIRWSPTENHFAMKLEESEVVHLREGTNGQLLVSFSTGSPHPGLGGPARALAWSRSGKVLAAGSYAGTFYAWDVGAALEDPKAILTHAVKKTGMIERTGRIRTAWDLAEEALIQVIAGDTSGTVEVFGRATALRPNEHRLHALLGISRGLTNDKKGAIEAINEAIKLQPREPYYRLWVLAFGGRPSNLDDLLAKESWLSSVALYLLGEIGERDLLAAINQGTREGGQIFLRGQTAHLAIGIKADFSGKESLARQHYYECSGQPATPLDGVWCRARLAQMKALPKKSKNGPA